VSQQEVEQAIEMNAMHGQQLNGLFGMQGRIQVSGPTISAAD
jgi:hypothetical protein